MKVGHIKFLSTVTVLFLVHWVALVWIYKRTYVCPLTRDHAVHDTHFWWSSGVSDHTGRHAADPWSFTHIFHGLVFYVLLHYATIKATRMSKWAERQCGSVIMFTFLVAITAEVGWEILENSPWIGKGYSRSMLYVGDDYINSFMDIVSMLIGFTVPTVLKLRPSEVLPILVCIECCLLMVMHDNFMCSTLNLIGHLIMPNWHSRPAFYQRFIQWQCEVIDSSVLVSSYCTGK